MFRHPARGLPDHLASVCAALGAALLASCSGTSWHEEPHDPVIHPVVGRLAARASSSTATYVGEEFESQQAALRDMPVEAPVQAF